MFALISQASCNVIIFFLLFHCRELEREDQAMDFEANAATQEIKDMSLKQGEKIKINIGGLVIVIYI